MGVSPGDLGDQPSELLVREVVLALFAAVVTDERLVEFVGLEVPERFRRVSLRAVARKVNDYRL